MASDLQNSSPVPTFRGKALVALLLPLFFEQLLSVTMGIADTMMVSGVGEAAVSSVSLVDSINTLVIQVLSALGTGGAVVASQYLGRRDYDNAQRGSAQLYSVLLFSTVTVSAVMLLFRTVILRTVFGAIDAEVMGMAGTYFFISALSYPFMGIYNAGAALFRAQGNSRISMFASLVMNIMNIGGNALLIYVCGLGVLGAAVATLVGRIFAAIFVTLQLQHVDNPLHIPSLAALAPDWSFIKRILGIGVPSGLENGMFQIGKLLVSSLTSTLGTAAIAANAVANSVSTMANIPGNAMNLGMITVVGQALGARDEKEARAGACRLLLIAYIGLSCANIALYFAIPTVSTWFHLTPETTALTVSIVRMFDIVACFLWPASFTIPNALRAGGDAKFTMLVSIFSMWVFRVCLTYYFVGALHMGLAGVWIGMFVDWGFRSILFVIRFCGNRWMRHKVI